MATRRRRSRRRWSLSRLHRRLLQHRATIVRAAFGIALLTAFWLFWPGPGQNALDRHRSGDQRLEEETWAGAGGLVNAARAGIAVSAKGQLVGEATTARDRLQGRLRDVAGTMPAIGPDLPAGDGLTVLPDVAAAEPEVAEAVEMAALTLGDPPGSQSEPPATVTAPRALVPAPPPARPRSFETVPAPPVAGPPPAAPVDAGPDASEVAGSAAAMRTAALLDPAEPDVGSAEARQALALAPARLLPPEIAPGRQPTWLQNAVAPEIDGRPAIAIVIDDLGVNRKGTEAVNDLAGPLTLAFLPYARNLTEQTRAARAAGHELIVHVPMEPVGDEWPGPDALLGSLEPAELVARLRNQLQSFGGYVGVNNHMGSLLTADSERMSLVMAELRRHGLLFLDSRTASQSVAAREARRLQVPYAERDVFLDNELDLDAVLRQLALTERIARLKGQAVAIGHPHAVTIAALRRWLPTLEARGFALAPISAIVARRSCAEGIVAMTDACARYTAIASLQP